MQIAKAIVDGLPRAGFGMTQPATGDGAATLFQLSPPDPKPHAFADVSGAPGAEKSALASLKALLMKQAFEAMLPKGAGTAQRSHLASDAWRSMLATSLAESVTRNTHTKTSPHVSTDGGSGAVMPSD